MSIEIEIKFRVTDAATLLAKIQQLGATPVSQSTQMDTYFAHPCRDFGQTDEALRIRSGPNANHLTFKGPKRGGPTKTREEIEIPFGGGPEDSHALARVLERLGFCPVAVIGKNRSAYHLERNGRALEIALDEAWNLGSFAEVETIATTEADVAAAQQAVQELAAELGLTEVEPRSYLRMALERTDR